MMLMLAALVGSTGCETMSSIMPESSSKKEARRLQRERDEANAKLDQAALEKKQLEEQLAKLRADLDAAKSDAERAKILESVKGQKGETSKEFMEVMQDELAKIPGATKVPGGARLNNDILFLAGKANVRSEAKSVLKRVATIVSKTGDDILIYIDGHTDSDPIKVSNWKDNYALGTARAEGVAKELVAAGIPQKKIVCRSFGPDFPIADNKSDTGKHQNRRVEMTLVRASDKPKMPEKMDGAPVMPQEAPPK